MHMESNAGPTQYACAEIKGVRGKRVIRDSR